MEKELHLVQRGLNADGLCAILFQRQGAVHLRTAAGMFKVGKQRAEGQKHRQERSRKIKGDENRDRGGKDKDKDRVNETGNHTASQRDLAKDSVFRPPVAGGLNTPL